MSIGQHIRSQLGDNQFPVFNTGNVGQHVQGNEPDHHVPYLFNYVGQPWKTQTAIAAATNVCYDNTRWYLRQ